MPPPAADPQRPRLFHLLLRRRHLAIEYLEFDAVGLFCQFSRLFHVVQQTNVGAPCHVLDCLLARRVIHQFVERFLRIVTLELLSLLRVIRDVAGDIRRRVEADRAVYYYQPHSAVKVELEGLT